MLTKNDLENIKEVIKSEISDNNSRLFKVLATKEDIARIYVSQEQHREDINEVQKSVDNLYGVVKRNDEEQTVLAHTVLGNTKSISKIEKHVFAN